MECNVDKRSIIIGNQSNLIIPKILCFDIKYIGIKVDTLPSQLVEDYLLYNNQIYKYNTSGLGYVSIPDEYPLYFYDFKNNNIYHLIGQSPAYKVKCSKNDIAIWNYNACPNGFIRIMKYINNKWELCSQLYPNNVYKIENCDGNVYIDSSNDDKYLDVQSLNGLVVRNKFVPGLMPTLSPGSRLMYDPNKSALRSGTVDNNQWDDSHLGKDSVGFGRNVVSSGEGSLSHGVCTDGSNLKSEGIGSFTGGIIINIGEIIASGNGSNAEGYADNSSIIATGSGSKSSGYCFDNSKIESTHRGSMACGAAVAYGVISSSGLGSFTAGYAQVNSSITTSVGGFTLAKAFYNSNITNKGNGSFTTGYAYLYSNITNNANGCFTGGNANKTSIIETSGSSSFCFGKANDHSHLLAVGEGSRSLGYAYNNSKIQSISQGSTALGSSVVNSNIKSSGVGGLVSGSANNGSIIESTGNGSFVSGIAMNQETISVTSKGSLTSGRHLSNNQDYSTLLGAYGISKSVTNCSPHTIRGEGSLQIAGGVDKDVTDGISVVIGTSIKDNITPIGGGIGNFWCSTGADYAEYFEWSDSNVNDEERIGYFVTMDDLNPEKIKLSPDADNVIGISTPPGTSGIVGDCAELRWHKTKINNEYGQPIVEHNYERALRSLLNDHKFTIDEDLDNILKTNNPNIKDKCLEYLNKDEGLQQDLKDKIANISPVYEILSNPEYDHKRQYIPRSQRKEWTTVGLLGKLHVRDNGKCQPGKKCSVLNGIAIPGNKWYVLCRTSDNVIKILFK